MKKTNVIVSLLMTVLMLTSVIFLNAKTKKPSVEIAILLDTSGSMEGLIDQAKTQLWKIVNEMATAKRDGVAPELKVALYEYGKSSLPASEGYMRMIVPLSTDLDLLSEELFKLKTNGGSEYCGMVIGKAVKELKWSKSNKDYKVIFIAGNEPFTQGKIDYRMTCKNAITNGIIVNTIFCGNFDSGIKTKWKDGSDLADGTYMNIDQNKKIAYISAPQDKELIKLGKRLNETYVSFGSVGAKMKERQKKQDKNALSMSPGVMVQRSVAKSSAQYRNESWDLVDAEGTGRVKVEELKKEELPEEMKKMSVKERKVYLQKKSEERKKLQKEIKKLKLERDRYIAKKRKESTEKDTLDSAIIGAIRKQAKKKKFEFEKK